MLVRPDGVVMKEPLVQIIPSLTPLTPLTLGLPCTGGIGFIALRLGVGAVLVRVVLGMIVIPGPSCILDWVRLVPLSKEIVLLGEYSDMLS